MKQTDRHFIVVDPGALGSLSPWQRYVLTTGLVLLTVILFGAIASFAGGQKLTAELRAEYKQRWTGMKINLAKIHYIDARIDRITHYQKQYETVSRVTDIPWYVIAVIDEMECGGGCCRHLHNGDSLKARTHNVPAGRPREGNPPFTWYASALDALEYDNLDAVTDWSVAGCLYQLETYNGWGYRKKGIPTPYLWSYSSVYKSGKFVRDGVYSPTAVSDQVGAAVLLHRMVDRNLIVITGREVKS